MRMIPKVRSIENNASLVLEFFICAMMSSIIIDTKSSGANFG
jgi:hypothetical protein